MADPKYAYLPGIVSISYVSCQSYVKILLLVNIITLQPCNSKFASVTVKVVKNNCLHIILHIILFYLLYELAHVSIFVSTPAIIFINIAFMQIGIRSIRLMYTRQLIYPNVNSFKFIRRYSIKYL